MSKFEVKSSKNGAQLKVKVLGTIDEDADFAPFGLTGVESVDLDLGGVKSINSCGIREWIKWVTTAGPAKVIYNNCPKVIMDQINMVQGFLPANGKVESFFVPYFCDDAGSEKNVLFRYNTEFNDTEVRPPAEVKDDQGNLMEMDVIEAKYFKFLRKG